MTHNLIVEHKTRLKKNRCYFIFIYSSFISFILYQLIYQYKILVKNKISSNCRQFYTKKNLIFRDARTQNVITKWNIRNSSRKLSNCCALKKNAHLGMCLIINSSTNNVSHGASRTLHPQSRNWFSFMFRVIHNFRSILGESAFF